MKYKKKHSSYEKYDISSDQVRTLIPLEVSFNE